MAEGGGLLNRYRLVKAYRGFESLRLRHRINCPGRLRSPPAENRCTREKTPWRPEGSGPSPRPGEGQDDNLPGMRLGLHQGPPIGLEERRACRAVVGHPLRRGAYPIIGKLPVGGISTDLVLKVLEQPVGDQADAPKFWTARTGTASRVRGRIENVLDWAKAKKLRDGVRRQPTRCDRKVLQAFSASANVLKGEPPTLMAGLFK